MRRIFLSMGSNVEPEKNLPACLEKLKKKWRVLRVSSAYETDPVGPAGRSKFWNAAAEILTERDDAGLREELRTIEAELGRARSSDKFASRTIDIDLLPQKDYQSQAFIVIPLAEIAAKEIEPETGRTYEELAAALAPQGQIKKIMYLA